MRIAPSAPLRADVTAVRIEHRCLRRFSLGGAIVAALDLDTYAAAGRLRGE
ncbi:hypothetical protein [Couchioplanes caeruleus]|uniref:hypothetical protein n=1 Tax=Couchioplanes caeruleus TaxID=56438 RepID=UPI000A862C6B|nr:hypothetical protein [Couchioplanes caeruleus]